MNTSYDNATCCHALLNLDGGYGSIHSARDFTREFLNELNPHVPSDITLDVLMLVTELVTNAVRHAPGPCTLYLVHALPQGSGWSELTVAVSDTSLAHPVPRPPGSSAGTGGLGWHMVRDLSTRVRIHVSPARGKTIETSLAIASPTQPADRP